MSLLCTKRENKLKVLIYMQYEYSNAMLYLIVHVSSTCLYLPIYLTYMDWIYCLPTEDGYWIQWIIYAYCLHTQGGGVYCIVVLLRVNVFIVHLPKVEIVCCLHAPRWDVLYDVKSIPTQGGGCQLSRCIPTQGGGCLLSRCISTQGGGCLLSRCMTPFCWLCRWSQEMLDRLSPTQYTI